MHKTQMYHCGNARGGSRSKEGIRCIALSRLVVISSLVFVFGSGYPEKEDRERERVQGEKAPKAPRAEVSPTGQKLHYLRQPFQR